MDNSNKNTDATAAGLALVKQLGSWNRQKRSAAEQKLQTMGADGIDLLLSFLKDATSKRLWRYFGLYFVFFIITEILISLIIKIGHGHDLTGTWRSAFITTVCICVATRFAVTRAQIRAAMVLASTADMRAVVPLIDALNYPGKATRRAAAIALTRLLPQIQGGDAALITDEQRKLLNRILSYNRRSLRRLGADTELIVAILKALEQMGDVAALPAVKKLAAGGGMAHQDPGVREAAIHCLPFLREQSPERNSQTLLRPSASGDPAGDTLLRPAANTSSEPQQLLRASYSEDSE